MGAIFRREFKSYFITPIGYIQIAVLAFFAGLFFVMINVSSKSSNLGAVFSNVFMFCMLALPISTMRLFSDEKRQKTDQLLSTSPVSITGIVVGKFLAAYAVLAMSMIIFMVFAVIIAFQTTPEWSVIIGNLLGLMLIGGLVIAIGLLISSLTESQIIAALGTMGIVFFLLLVDSFAAYLPQWQWIATVLSFISISARHSSFVNGLIQYDNIIFFISFQALFLFLTVRTLDSKRWS